MRQSLRLGTIAGIAVGLNWSVVVILALFAWELADQVLPVTPGAPTAADWVAGVLGAVVVLASLLAHELSHALVARRNGVGVRSITLFMFGGVALLEGEPPTPGADFRVAAVGPATSLGLAVVFGGIELVAGAAGAHGLAVGVLSWLWKINVLLAVFNLVPAAPLDGGRILRAGLWRHRGDRVRAAVTATRVGQVFGLVLVALGVLGALEFGVIGLWPALIGLFLYAAARTEQRVEVSTGGLGALRVGHVMAPHPPTFPDHTTVAELSAALAHYPRDAVAVTDARGWLAGVVTAAAVAAVPPPARATTTLARIAVPLSALPVARPEEPAAVLLQRMAAAGGAPVLVLDQSGHLAGLVTVTDLRRAQRGPVATGS